MMGGMLAGHDQCSGEVIEKNGKKYKLFYGMSSDTAMKKYVGGVAEYRWGTDVSGCTIIIDFINVATNKLLGNSVAYVIILMLAQWHN